MILHRPFQWLYSFLFVIWGYKPRPVPLAGSLSPCFSHHSSVSCQPSLADLYRKRVLTVIDPVVPGCTLTGWVLYRHAFPFIHILQLLNMVNTTWSPNFKQVITLFYIQVVVNLWSIRVTTARLQHKCRPAVQAHCSFCTATATLIVLAQCWKQSWWSSFLPCLFVSWKFLSKTLQYVFCFYCKAWIMQAPFNTGNIW